MKGLKGINLLFGEISPEELKKIQGSTEGFTEQIQRYQRRPLEEERKAVTIASSHGLK